MLLNLKTNLQECDKNHFKLSKKSIFPRFIESISCDKELRMLDLVNQRTSQKKYSKCRPIDE